VFKLSALALLFLLIAAIHVPSRAVEFSPPANETEFFTLMKTVADGWNQGNARKAADCFSENAVYLEPPNRQVYSGRQALYNFFGGTTRPEPQMKMEWHHLAFNAREQVGYGEYTFQGHNRYHGIVTVLIESGTISKWREYQYQSQTDWAEFAGNSRF
jgi:hypothetical protein